MCRKNLEAPSSIIVCGKKMAVQKMKSFPLLPLSLALESSPCVERWRPAISTVTLWMESPKDFSRRTTERWTTVAFDSASRRSSLRKEREKGK